MNSTGAPAPRGLQRSGAFFGHAGAYASSICGGTTGDWQLPKMHVLGGAHFGPLSGPGTLLPGGGGGYTAHRDSSGTRSSGWPLDGAKCVDERRVSRGPAPEVLPIASTETSTCAVGSPIGALTVFSHGGIGE